MFYENGWVRFYGNDGRGLANKHSANMKNIKSAIVDLLGEKYRKQIDLSVDQTNFLYFGNSCKEDITNNKIKQINDYCRENNLPSSLQRVLLEYDVDLNDDRNYGYVELLRTYLKHEHPLFLFFLEKSDKLEEFKDLLIAAKQEDSAAFANYVRGEYGYKYDKLEDIHADYKTLLDADEKILEMNAEYFYNYLNDAGIWDRLMDLSFTEEGMHSLLDQMMDGIFECPKTSSFACPAFSENDFVANNLFIFGGIDMAALDLIVGVAASNMDWKAEGSDKYRIGFMTPGKDNNGLGGMWVNWCSAQVMKILSARNQNIIIYDNNKDLSCMRKYFDPFFEKYKAEMAEYFFTADNSKLINAMGKEYFEKIDQVANMMLIVINSGSTNEIDLASKIADAQIEKKDVSKLIREIDKRKMASCDIHTVEYLSKFFLYVHYLISEDQKKHD